MNSLILSKTFFLRFVMQFLSSCASHSPGGCKEFEQDSLSEVTVSESAVSGETRARSLDGPSWKSHQAGNHRPVPYKDISDVSFRSCIRFTGKGMRGQWHHKSLMSGTNGLTLAWPLILDKPLSRHTPVVPESCVPANSPSAPLPSSRQAGWYLHSPS